MSNIKNKRNNLALIEEMIEKETEGFQNIAKSIDFIMTDIFKIKKALVAKSKTVAGYEKELYYKISVKINLKNYMEYFKVLDEHIRRKGKSINKNTAIEEIANPIDYKDLELAPRVNAEITVGEKGISDNLKMRLKNFIYLNNSSDKRIDVYLRNTTDYNKNLNELKYIKKSLYSVGYNLNIHILGESNIIKSMDKKEKREFNEVFNKF